MEKHLVTLCGLIFLALGHIFIRKVQLHNIARSHKWLSFGAGASVAYVFVHVFPEIGIFQQKLQGYSEHNNHGGFIAHHLYLAALGGVFFLHFIDSLESRMREEEEILSRHKFFIPILITNLVLYFLYNLMVSYIITHRQGEGILNIILITVGLMLHFVVINLNAIESYDKLYDKYVRWIASAGLLTGWILGVTTHINRVTGMTIFSFIGGIITYIALKNELGHTKSRAPFYFFTGAIIYTLILLAIPYFGHSGAINH